MPLNAEGHLGPANDADIPKELPKETTFKFLARTGRRLRSFAGKIIKPFAKNGRFTVKLTLSIPLLVKVELGAEWSRNKLR